VARGQTTLVELDRVTFADPEPAGPEPASPEPVHLLEAPGHGAR
jgi:hypothetical protein